MRILAGIVLAGIAGSMLFSVSALADSANVEILEAEQKSKIEQAKEISSEIQSYNKNFISPVYLSEVDERKLAASISRAKPIDYINLSAKDFIINASAYTAAADECGKSDGITASGKKVSENKTLACPKSYPFGTKIQIDGMGTYTCEDRGGAIKGNHFDIYMETKKQAFAFGRRNLTARIVD